MEILEQIIVISFFSFCFTIAQLLILNGIRYLKYKKIIIQTSDFFFKLSADKERDYKNFALSCIIGGIFFNIFLYAGLILVAQENVLFSFVIIVWTIIASILFYWYWHTEKDPFGDFEFELRGL
ncbi:MAG TPA: hypothetical protein PLU96_06580 [Methanofastidiosum sp.]|nr:hypothetical protein [Methanofastidiosum sp.]